MIFIDVGRLSIAAEPSHQRHFAPRTSTNTYGWFRWLFDRFDLPATCRILDLGAGPGDLWLQNLNRLEDGWAITLTDVSPGMLEKAQENLGSREHPFEFKLVDAQSIPFADRRFDAVVANHMLYHVPQLDKALAEIQRVLKPGRRFYASTVGWSHMQGLRELVRAFDAGVAVTNPSEVISFALENGHEHLDQWFSEVNVYRYEDGLVVTKVEPLVAYVRSMSSLQSARIEHDPAAFARYVEAEMASQGAIHIAKDSGLLCGVR